MRNVKVNADGKRDPVICISCARNKHKMCDLHMNDGAFDALDFIHVRCDCFCKGQIGTVYDSLLDMAKKYAEDCEEAIAEAREMKMLAARAAGVADEVLEAIRGFDNRARDDEGNFLPGNSRNLYESVLDEFYARIDGIAKRSDAVLGTIVDGLRPGSDLIPTDLIKRLFERSAQDEERDREKSKPFWERMAEDPDSAGQFDDDDEDDFDGPIGDGKQGPQPDMLKQHQTVQAAREARREEELGWPVD
jgi:hypothetical protein